MKKKYYCIEPDCNNEINYNTWKYGKQRCNLCYGKTVKTKVKVKCSYTGCNKEIEVPAYKLKIQNNFYCNKKCFSKSRISIKEEKMKALTKEFFLKEYIKNKKTGKEIAKEFDISTKWVYKLLANFDIPRRMRIHEFPNICIEPNCNKILSARKYKRCRKHRSQYLGKQEWYRKTKSIAGIKSWYSQSDDIRQAKIKKVLRAQKNQINKSELILNDLLIKTLGREYKFVGNGKVIIEKYLPDFINIKGQKKIIEFFGCYWHKCKKCGHSDNNLLAHDIGRLKTYRKNGYETLIIWEHELKDLDKVKQRILEFNEV